MMLRISLSTMAALAATGLLIACGSSGLHEESTVASDTGAASTRVSEAHAPSRQEAAKARVCLKKEGFRTSVRGQIQHGDPGLMRYGYPVTQREYASAVRRCIDRKR